MLMKENKNSLWETKTYFIRKAWKEILPTSSVWGKLG